VRLSAEAEILRSAELFASIHKRQNHADEAHDHNSYSAKQDPPNIVVGMLLLEPVGFSFITRPTKCCFRMFPDQRLIDRRTLGSSGAVKLWQAGSQLIIGEGIERTFLNLASAPAQSACGSTVSVAARACAS
jgi:hypothetical protein